MNIAIRQDKSRAPTPALALGAASFVADPMGALYWPEERLLVVADLHLEKGASYARRRVFLPPYDTAMTLAALAALIARYAPRVLIALGDSFHDVEGGERLPGQFRAALRHLQTGRTWIWIAGNHDPHLPADLGGARHDELVIANITFRHEPMAEAGAEIAGHLHPVARVVGSTGSIRRRCFLTDGTRCIMPAFGAYAGGLNLHDRAFAPLFSGGERFAHVMGRERVYKISHRQCLPD
jgi:DNA ligase-associated metallophosphoesterase